LFRRLLLLYAAYFLTRLLFFAFNYRFFSEVSILNFLWDSIAGLRFDTFSILVASSVFILLSLLPFNLFWRVWYQRLLKIFYFIPNGIFLGFNVIDCAYYSFIKKRSTSEILEQIRGQSDLTKLLPQFVRDFWALFLAWLLLLVLLTFWYRAIRVKQNSTPNKNKPLVNWLLFVFCVGVSVLGLRGGLQKIPIDVVNAGGMVTVDEIPLVLNTPFTIIKSFGHPQLEPLNYYSNEELKKIYSPLHQFDYPSMRKKNVVVLILESFSKEYTALGKLTSCTPFLDSIMGKSLVFSNGFSNGTKSIEGIPSILSSLPSMMPNPFINSIYANNKQSSLAYLLGQEGYETAFFHGGINGTMNFTEWAALAGYSEYYGKNEYTNENDFDGFWGIFDEPFLQFSVEKMSEMKQPFHSAIFTLSSHHPYVVPDKYKGRFKKTDLKNSESIGYADYSLRKFFESAKKQAWYSSTLFVLVADHTGISEHPFFTIVGLSSIPIVFFAPGDTTLIGTHALPFSQIDILPSVLDYLNYNKPFFAFGNAYKEKQQGFDYMYAAPVAYDFNDSTVYFHSNGECSAAFNYKRDSTLKAPIFGKYPHLDAQEIAKYRAFMQCYEKTLNGNSGTVSY
jgi:glucan phosphoethanolaminetransferase (alkaline phosphatase superfamily)